MLAVAKDASSKGIGTVLTTHAIALWRSARLAHEASFEVEERKLCRLARGNPAMLLICGRCCVCSRAEQSAARCAHKHLLLRASRPWPPAGPAPVPNAACPLRQDQRRFVVNRPKRKSANPPPRERRAEMGWSVAAERHCGIRRAGLARIILSPILPSRRERDLLCGSVAGRHWCGRYGYSQTTAFHPFVTSGPARATTDLGLGCVKTSIAESSADL